MNNLFRDFSKLPELISLLQTRMEGKIWTVLVGCLAALYVMHADDKVSQWRNGTHKMTYSQGKVHFHIINPKLLSQQVERYVIILCVGEFSNGPTAGAVSGAWGSAEQLGAEGEPERSQWGRGRPGGGRGAT